MRFGALLHAVAACLSAALLAAQPAPCPERRVPSGDLGIRALSCTGPAASCSIAVQERDGIRHVFAVEPVITRLDPAARTLEQLRVGDAIVAVDGMLITTVEGGRRLAQLRADVPVDVVIRRDGQPRTMRLIPRLGCGITSLVVTR